MFDRPARRLYMPIADRAAGALQASGIRPGTVTAVALIVGVGACVSAALSAWTAALCLWLANRLLDGLDGPLARRRAPSDLGGMLDLLADFVIYGGFPVAVATALPRARLACVALLGAYLLNVVALLSFAALSERHGPSLDDERSLPLTAGLAEGTETIAAYSAICLAPAHAALIAWIFTAVVLATVIQRVAIAIHALDGRLVRRQHADT